MSDLTDQCALWYDRSMDTSTQIISRVNQMLESQHGYHATDWSFLVTLKDEMQMQIAEGETKTIWVKLDSEVQISITDAQYLITNYLNK